MLKEINWAGVADLSTTGVPMTVGAALSASGGDGNVNRDLLTVPDGYCFIATKFSGTLCGNEGGAGLLPSPTLSARQFTGLIGSVGVSAAETIQTMSWVRWAALFNGGAGTTWRNAPIIDTWKWKPQWPICFPSGRRIRSLNAQLTANGNVAYGYLVPESTAATLGFDTNPALPSASRLTNVVSVMPTVTTAVTAIPAKTGFSIQILDIWLRVQPLATATACFLRVQQNLSTVLTTVFQVNNDNPANLIEEQLSPGLFLSPGASLELVSSAAYTGSAVISYRYVKAEDVPDDHWWYHVAPARSGTSATEILGALGSYTAASAAVVPYFPAKNASASGGLAGRGMQHWLHGFLISMAHDPSDGVVFTNPLGATSWYRLSAGAVGGRIGIGSTPGVPPDQVELGSPLTPVVNCTGHESAVALSESQLMVRTAENHGIWIDQASFGVTDAAANLRNCNITVWGRRGAIQGDTVGQPKRGRQR